MKLLVIGMVAALGATTACASGISPGRVELLCHRTANQDLPENTLESLEQAALLGCDVVEIDLRKTLDGMIVLNHDGVLERLTDGIGDAEQSYYGDLQLRDAGAWMGERFAGMHITTLEDALRLARERDIRLILDIKTRGIGADVLELLAREGMLERVQFNGEWSDVKQLDAGATDAGVGTAWVQPGVTAEQVKEHHLKGEAVIANFSANEHEMDLAGMKAAVAAGVDGINVDYPRLGADAVGRPVERRLQALAAQADAGQSNARAQAILELSRYQGFPLRDNFLRWLTDSDDAVSRAAALALVMARPATPATEFAPALRSEHADARANAAWALGILRAPASWFVPLLQDQDARVLQETLMALGRAPGDVSASALLPMLAHAVPAVRGAAAVALAHHQPEVAIHAIPAQLHVEMQAARVIYEDHQTHGQHSFSKEQIAAVMALFRCQMKMMQAISSIDGGEATHALEEQAFRPGKDFSQMNAVVAAFDLWDRIGTDAGPAVNALGSIDNDVADRAEWMLVQSGPAVLPAVRKMLGNQNPAVRERAIRIVAWQGDLEALEALQAIRKSNAPDAGLAGWAIAKIEMLHPLL